MKKNGRQKKCTKLDYFAWLLFFVMQQISTKIYRARVDKNKINFDFYADDSMFY
jgi:hypothetical protein